MSGSGRISTLAPALAMALALATASLAQTPTPPPSPTPTQEFQPPRSLLFSEREVQLIEQALRDRQGRLANVGTATAIDELADLPMQDLPSDKKTPKPQVTAMHLAAILYFDPKRWTIWLNNQQVTPGHLLENVEKLTVSRNWIDMTLRPHDDKPRTRVRLSPNQSYILATGEVIEGAPPQVEAPPPPSPEPQP